MKRELRFIIPDCYTDKSRAHFDKHGVTYAGILYANMLIKHLPEAKYDIFYTSSSDILPEGDELDKYSAIIWPGCNLTVYHEHDERVVKLVKLSKEAYEKGLPQFGSCWAAQIAVYAAGGKVAANPKGREMGIARKIYLTDEGKTHPLMEGKPHVFDAFVSHDDIITEVPDGGTVLASNDFAPVQAIEVKHKKGVFWATQYHPELNLKEIARLISAREEILTKQGYFRNHEDLLSYVEDLETVFNDPSRKDLRWKYDIDDTILSDEMREKEFVNWLKKMVIA